jgi:hypothetical protein
MYFKRLEASLGSLLAGDGRFCWPQRAGSAIPTGVTAHAQRMPGRPRPVTLLPGVDEALAVHYRAEAALILARMRERSKQHPLLRWLYATVEDLTRALRVALS